MRSAVHIIRLTAAAALAVGFGSFDLDAKPATTSGRAAALYAIRGARIIPVSGAAIDKGTIVMRDGVIVDVGAAVTAPADAIVIDGAGLTVYPGLIDMANTTAVESSDAGAGAGGGRGAAPAGGGGRGGAPAGPQPTLEDLERAKRASILRPDFEAARNVRVDGAEMQRLASAGITSVLAVPPSGVFRGQSALINVLAPEDDPQISNIGDYRRGLVVVRTPVALHVAFGGGQGGGYPGSLLGYVAFIRQSFYDAQWQRDARAYAERHKDAPRAVFEPVLDAMLPALEKKLPVAFEVSAEREIRRALAIAREFNLDPIVTGAAEAAATADDLKAANARVIYTLNFGGGGGGGGGRGGGGGGGGRGGGGDETLRAVRARVNAPRAPAALEKAGVPYAFTSGGLQDFGDFVRNAARVVKEGNLPADATLRALTVNAARMAGAADRLGTIEKGKIANLLVTEGDLFENGRIRHVFIDGRPVEIETPAPAPTGRGRGGH
ncbi:MAG TPA: amidohydrolase family protein [Vicinamibacterales bacterium]|nr:amidohydrolase family protein [Vicinamibacterales bacterium]